MELTYPNAPQNMTTTTRQHNHDCRHTCCQTPHDPKHKHTTDPNNCPHCPQLSTITQQPTLPEWKQNPPPPENR